MTQPLRPARLDPATVREWPASADGGPRLLDVRTAALTKACLMGTQLSKLPFNRAAGCDIDAVVRQLVDTNPVRS